MRSELNALLKPCLKTTQIFQPVDRETADCALEATQTLIRIIYSANDAVVAKDTVPEGLGKQVVEECLEFLEEPEKSKAKPALQVLATLVRTTRMANNSVFICILKLKV